MTQNTQYQAWHKTFREQQSFNKDADLKSKKTQIEFTANAPDQRLDNLMRFIETSSPYMFD